MNNAPFALGDYKVGKRIASGGFGFVYSGKAPDGKKVAIKYERTYNRITRPYLQHEADVYRLFEDNPCVPKVYAYGREGRWNIMVFDFLGTSLETLFEKCEFKFSLKTMLMLAPQIIECIEHVHSKGIIHRDIKPDNFLMGIGERANFVHIIDFGLSRRFRHPRTLEHFPYFEGHNFFGTTRFASLKALEGCSQSRRDDLESAAYALVYFMRGRLPWQGLRGGTEKHHDQRVREKKRTWTPERLCEGLPGAEELIKMLHYIKSLSYTDGPDYAYLKGLFQERLAKEGYELDYDYDWLHVVEVESEMGDNLSLIGSKKNSKLQSTKSASAKVLVDHGSADNKDDAPPREASRSVAHENLLSPAHSKSETGSESSPISSVVKFMKERVASRSPSRSHFSLPSAKNSQASRRDAPGSGTPRSSASKRSNARRSRSTGSRWSSDSSISEEVPVKRGDFVLIMFLARPTLERYGVGLKTASSAPVDNSYWHNPSLSEDEWHFPFRPALVTKTVDFGKYTSLFVLPIMQRSDGLEKVSPARRPAFFKLGSGKDAESGSQSDKEEALELKPSPAWPFNGAYVIHQQDIFRIHVLTDAIKDIKVVWRLEKPQLKRLLRARDGIMKTLNNDDYLSDAGSETEEVRGRLRRRRVASYYHQFGDIASLTEHAFARPDVELKGLNGWLPEHFKIERRRNHENGYYSGDSDCAEDEENVSMYTGPAPGNRRLSCTLAIDGDVIVEAASQAGSDSGSVASSKYRSPRSSKTGSYRRSRASSKASSAAGSAPKRSARSLRHAVLDLALRSGYSSPAESGHGSDSGSNSRSLDSDVSSHVNSAPASPSTLSSHDKLRRDSLISSGDDSNVASVLASSTESRVGSSLDSESHHACVSEDCSCGGSASGSVARSAAGSIASLVGSVVSSINEIATAVERKIMVDKAIQTDATDDTIHPETPGSAGEDYIKAQA